VQLVDTVKRMNSLLVSSTKLLEIDDSHGFQAVEFVDFCRNLIGKGVQLVVSGPDRDFRAELFEATHRLKAIANEHIEFNALCLAKRGYDIPATRTQRFINGELAAWDTLPTIIAGVDVYKPVCYYHFCCTGKIRERRSTVSQRVRPWVIAIVGSMFSGKTEELIRLLNRHVYAKRKVRLFKPAIDTRYEDEVDDINRAVVSHDGSTFQCQAVHAAAAMLKLVGDAEVVGIDEAQFFGEDIVWVVEELANSGRVVIVAGLNLNALDEPFGHMAELMARADHVETVHAVCQCCGDDASRTLLRVDKQDVPWQEGGKLILVGGEDMGYGALCRECRNKRGIPGKPGLRASLT
jgi:thymidine kinase